MVSLRALLLTYILMAACLVGAAVYVQTAANKEEAQTYEIFELSLELSSRTSELIEVGISLVQGNPRAGDQWQRSFLHITESIEQFYDDDFIATHDLIRGDISKVYSYLDNLNALQKRVLMLTSRQGDIPQSIEDILFSQVLTQTKLVDELLERMSLQLLAQQKLKSEAAKQSVTIIISLLSVLIIVFIFNIGFSVLKKLTLLSKATLAITKGEDTQLLPKDKHTEIGLVFSYFNTMASSLAAADVQNTLQTQQISKMLSRLELAIDISEVGIWEFDLNTKVLTCDKKMKTIFSLTENANKSLWQMWFASIDNRDQDDFLDGIWNVNKKTEAWSAQFRALKSSGDICFFEINAICEPGEGNNRVIGTCLDVSKLRVLEQEALRLKELAEYSNDAKSNFLANMSHEIRTPMNAILGLTRLVLDTPLNSTQKNYLEKVHLSSNSLLNILNDILDYSKIEANQLDIVNQPFELSELLENVAGLFSIKAAEKNIDLLFDYPMDFYGHYLGDELRLSQVLNNLVSNAIKFTDEGAVTVCVAEKQRGDGYWLEFSVRDQGIGMTKEQIDLLFNPFTQADSSITRKFGGTGLGLSICRRLLDLMHGAIRVESELGKGSAFTFDLMMEGADKPAQTVDLSRLNSNYTLLDFNSNSNRYLERQFNHIAQSLEILTTAHTHIADNSTVIVRDSIGLSQLKHLFSHYQRPCLIISSAGKVLTLEGIDHLPKGSRILETPFLPEQLFENLVLLKTGEIDHTETHADSLVSAHSLSTDSIDGSKVLLVEDNEINQLVANEVLKAMGLRVSIANDGLEAVKMFAEHDYDVVLMDLQMPNMDGFEATKRIRVTHKGKQVPIIAMTAAALVEDKAEALAAGMDEHIAKPLDFEILSSVLTDFLSKPYEYHLKEPFI
jgi:signal transduction histidine kinase/ActR/RegA family two-component response regulator